MPRFPIRPWAVADLAPTPFPERPAPKSYQWDAAALWLARRVAPRPVRSARAFFRIVPLVEVHAKELATLSERGLLEAARALRKPLRAEGLSQALVGRAFACIREATRRHLGYAHYPVQLVGGYVMLNGRVAEMQTGEGKTITAMLPAITAGLVGVPVHVITVNDYLAKRDAEHLQPIYASLGLTIGLVEEGQEPEARGKAYAADVVYCTGKSLVFDYLRDRIDMRGRQTSARMLASQLSGVGPAGAGRTLRGLCFAVVDEADSVLIDEARTPLIISAQKAADPTSQKMTSAALAVALTLRLDEDFRISAKEHLLTLTERGRAAAGQLMGIAGGVWKTRKAAEGLLEQALAGVHLYQKDRHYIVADGKVQIVDEYTGRVMADRSWESGLHQAIEAKEGLAQTGGRITLGQLTYQRFFRRYLWLCGMTGTVTEVAGEMKQVYGLQVTRVPTHRPPRREDRGLSVYRSAGQRWQAVAANAKAVAASGRPVLVGTRSVAASETIGALLDTAGTAFTVLNARQDKQEANIIADAGLPCTITVATNMAGRGTDIRLPPGVSDAGGLHIIVTEFHESSRIDRQLIGRCGRQGDRGSYQAIVSLEDELFSTHAPLLLRLIVGVFRAGRPPSLTGLLLRRWAQRNAERRFRAIRRHTLKADEHLDKTMAFTGWRD